MMAGVGYGRSAGRHRGVSPGYVCVSLRAKQAGQQWPVENRNRQAREEPRMKKLLLVMLAAAPALFVGAARADDFPKRPISLISVFGPDSASDTVCRVLADPLSTAIKQPVVVENRQGANGAIAA